MTRYIVLERIEGEPDAEGAEGPLSWKVIEEVEADGASAAMKVVAETRDSPATLVAVPERSFQPRTVKVESRLVAAKTDDAAVVPEEQQTLAEEPVEA